MNLSDFLPGYKDPARHWPPPKDLIPEFNLDQHALGGVALGDPWDRLALWGPPEQRRKKPEDTFWYYSKGFSVDVDGRQVSCYSLVWRDYLQQGFRPFGGRFQYRGQPIRLNSATTEDQLVGLFEEPYWQDEDDDEIILFYEPQPDVEWQFELDLERRLKSLIVLTHPNMADDEFREAYHVTKPWPPES
jgi:hypothetical protein